MSPAAPMPQSKYKVFMQIPPKIKKAHEPHTVRAPPLAQFNPIKKDPALQRPAASCRNKYSIPPQSDDVKPNQNRKVFPPRKNTNFRKNRVDFCVPMYYNNDCLKRAVCSSCNKRVSRFYNMSLRLRSSVYGGVPEWPKGTDCKSAASCFGGSNPPSSTRKKDFAFCKVLFSTKRIPSVCEIALRAVKYTASPNHPWFCAITPTNACGT